MCIVKTVCFNKDSFANKEIKFCEVILDGKKTLKMNYWWSVKKEKK